jgi:hypothetical protein
MNMKGKIDLYAKKRHEYRWGVGTIRGLAQMFKVHRRLVQGCARQPSSAETENTPEAAYTTTPSTAERLYGGEELSHAM